MELQLLTEVDIGVCSKDGRELNLMLHDSSRESIQVVTCDKREGSLFRQELGVFFLEKQLSS
jgi:hypothetical protein